MRETILEDRFNIMSYEQDAVALLLTKSVKDGLNGFFGVFGEIDPCLEIRLDPLKITKKGFLNNNLSYTIIPPPRKLDVPLKPFHKT